MIDIQAQNFSLTEGIKTHIEEKLEPINQHFGEHISNIHVHISDDNGPKGGDDKRCLLHIELLKLPTVIIEDNEEDLYTAIDNCCHRAERAVRKAIEKKLSRERR